MNLIEIQKRAGYNRFISIAICVLLVLTLFLSSYIQADAIAPLVIYGGIAVAAALLVACGYYSLTSGDVSGAWDTMSTSLKNGLTEAGKHMRRSAENFALARGVISGALFGEFKSWFASEASDGVLTSINTFDIVKSQAYPYPSKMNYYKADLFQAGINHALASTYTYVFMDYKMSSASQNSDYSMSNHMVVYESNTPFYLTVDSDEVIIKNDGTFIKNDFTRNSDYIISNSVLTYYTNVASYYYFDGTSNSYKFYYSKAPIYLTVNGAIKGVLYHDSVSVSYAYNPAYDPAVNPPSVDPDGNIPITVPYTSNPDTNVAIPAGNSIDNPISLQTVIDGYGSIDGFFEAGGKITLSDGTVISGSTGANELGRADGDVLPDAGTGTVEGDVSGIKSLVHKVLEVLTGIGAAVGTGIATIIDKLTDPFNWDKAPKGPGVIQGIGAFFAVLLALLIAIMHLIAKVIAFIGQLYAIPASSAMLHPTMIQGIEWARGFHTAGGVNLYSLISGVISIVLGIVCFKLLRKIITGIGTASYTENDRSSSKISEV